jgi:protocatechuate 3,4-dioxygenase beta subunit
MKRVLLGCAVVLVAILAIWNLTNRGGDDAKPAAPKAAPVDRPKLDRPPDKARDGNADVEAPLLIDDDPKGKLRLEGIVVDASNNPVGGAVVTLSSNPPRSKTTEADGGFFFDDLVGRPYTLVARAPGGVAGPVTARLTDKTELVTLHVRPASKLTVTVTGADGKPIDGATVELRGVDDQREVSKRGVATFAAVVPSNYQLAGWAEGLARTHAWVNVGAGETQAKLVLVAGAPVAGKVVDERGAPVAGARVVYSGASDWSQQGSDPDAVTTEGDGVFRFAALPAGSFRFVASHDAHAPGTSAIVTLDGAHERTGVTIAMSDGVTVRGRVVDSSKRPLAGARVRVGVQSKGMLFDPPRQAYSDETGSFEIRGLPKRALVAVAIHESGASQNVTVDAAAGNPGSIELVIDVTGVIAGVVVDPSGQPVEGAQVSAGPDFSKQGLDMQQWRLRGFPQELTDSSGHFTLTGLAPGSYRVSASQARTARGQGFGPPGGIGNGVVAQTGDKNLKLTLQPEGAVKGTVAFTDGSAPALFTVSLGMTQQSFTGGGAFQLDGLPPQHYELTVRGPQFQTRAIDVLVESGKTVDVGAIAVAPGRGLGGVVVANGSPVPGASVYAGRIVFGNGTSSNAQFGPMGQSTKNTTTGDDGTFSLSGFSDGDLAIVAEHPTLGRSKALRLPTDMPGQTELTLELQPFGALSGVLRQGGKPVEGVFVSCQSTTTPGALYSVASGPDGSYRFDRLAPDTYKVSATLGMPMVGMKFYSKQIDVPSGKEVTIDLVVDPGTIALDVTAVPKTGTLGVANAWLATGTVTASTATELSLKIAALGASHTQWVVIRNGEPAHFTEVVPGSYSACIVPFPAEVRGMGAMGYQERHGDKLPAFCQPVAVGASPDSQAANVAVVIPPFIPDPGQGSGSGSGTSGSGSAGK